MDDRRWTIDCGLWTVDTAFSGTGHRLWTINCGLWTVDYGLSHAKGIPLGKDAFPNVPETPLDKKVFHYIQNFIKPALR